ncbi:site-specific integrase [Pseudoalteromonas sp. A41-2]|uniref:gamma-mobile-trio recombinase GmtY n=1 Tax=Pseudoalteromonas sp. A41-2 TaxID=2785910 RepID=UPI0018C9FD35|nr:gamma-mobile-trio recombinase GmtY [Pseudoalteromonas sp. A41-2]QPL43496.1 site-specific integrase [Pseudoalteromonas sp. A41-2]
MNDGYYIHSATRPHRVSIDKSQPVRATAIYCDGSVLFSGLKYLVLMKKNKGVSESWERQFIQAMRLLLDYSIANNGYFENAKDMFESFAYRLQTGTVDENGNDHSGLRWDPKSSNSSKRILKKITGFSDWLYDESGGKSELLNPLREATLAEKVLNTAAYNHRHNNAFLKHTFSSSKKEEKLSNVRNTKIESFPTVDFEPKKAFPDERFIDLLFDGFKKKKSKLTDPIHIKYRIDYILITILQHLGGLRLSEVFHIYVDDIIPNEEGQQIRVYHPCEGLAPEHARRKYKHGHMSRKQYLAKAFHMQDRLHMKGRLHAGWKNSVVNETGKFFHVFLFGFQELQKLFFELFRLYIEIRQEPLKGREHPFLFTDNNGDPLSMVAYIRAHSRAVKRIGMTPKLDYSGTPHCHRHAYGKRLANANIDPILIKRCLHHASLEAQQAYTQPQIRETTEALKKGIERLEHQEQKFESLNSINSLANF